MFRAAGPDRVGVKLRLGPKPPARVDLDLAPRLAEAGVAWLTLHPRHASQGFSGLADRDALAAFVAVSPLPVVASGDLFDAVDAMHGPTGVAGVQALPKSGHRLGGSLPLRTSPQRQPAKGGTSWSVTPSARAASKSA